MAQAATDLPQAVSLGEVLHGRGPGLGRALHQDWRGLAARDRRRSRADSDRRAARQPHFLLEEYEEEELEDRLTRQEFHRVHHFGLASGQSELWAIPELKG